MRHRIFSQAGFTLMELMVVMSVGVVVAALSYSYLRTGTLLYAKNVSLNLGNNDLRSSLDQIGDRLQSAVRVPVLIDTTGAVTAVTPAAGVYYDRLLGDPYVLTHPGGSGIASTATAITLQRSMSVYAGPPLPVNGDVLLIDGAPSNLRPRVSSTALGATAAGVQTFTVTLTAAIGAAISWDATQPKTTQLVRREALIVMPAGARPELRRYPSFETTTNLNDPTGYFVVSRQVGGQTSEATPFSITSAGLDRLLNIDFRVRPRGFDNVLANKEANQFSNYMRIQCIIPSRLRPKN